MTDIPDVDGVPGIRSTLVPDHRIDICRQNIDDLALTFISPVQSHNADMLHRLLQFHHEPPSLSVGVISVSPPMYGTSTSGIFTDPSARWLFSRIAISTLGVAIAVLLRVWQK